MIKDLHADDVRWAADHDTQPRNLFAKLNRAGVANEINRRGLDGYHPDPRFDTFELAARERTWYRTRPLPDDFEIDHHGLIDLETGSPDAEKLARNVSDSVNMNLGPGDSPVSWVGIERVARPRKPQEQPGALRRSGPVVFSEPETDVAQDFEL